MPREDSAQRQKEERTIFELFRISVILKGLISVTEVVAGTLLLVIPTAAITKIILLLAHGELVEETSSTLANYAALFANSFTVSVQLFVAFYLLSRGLIKVLLVVGLLKGKLWAYPASLVVLNLFVAYQLYQIATTRSFLVILITIFDVVVIYFIWREYKIVREHLARLALAETAKHELKK